VKIGIKKWLTVSKSRGERLKRGGRGDRQPRLFKAIGEARNPRVGRGKGGPGERGSGRGGGAPRRGDYQPPIRNSKNARPKVQPSTKGPRVGPNKLDMWQKPNCATIKQ